MAVIKDVAKLAEVSVGAVSKYLNNPERMREDTKQKIQAAIEKLQYTPSLLARSMRTGRTNTIAVIAPDITNPFFAEVYNAIRLESVSNGYIPILYTTEDDVGTLKKYLEDIPVHQIDGIILCFVEEDELIKNLIEKIQTRIPIVLFSWDINNTKFNSICIDVFEGIYASTTHLIRLGHKNIAYVGGNKSNKISREKHKGHISALQNAGLKAGCFHSGDFNLQTGYLAAVKFLMQSEVPTAIVAENDIIAIGCMKYLLQKGTKIPDDLAIIGFDNIALSSMYEPSLSTISLPIAEMAEEAMKLLVSLLNTSNSNMKGKVVIMKNELVVRNSTDKSIPAQFPVC